MPRRNGAGTVYHIQINNSPNCRVQLPGSELHHSPGLLSQIKRVWRFLRSLWAGG
jgi:hypothetical protein